MTRGFAGAPTPIDTPEALMLAWPTDTPMVVLYSGEGQSDRSRWSLVADPSQVIVIDGDIQEAIDTVVAETGRVGTDRCAAAGSPLGTGWVLAASYELGSHLEPSVPGRAPSPNHGERVARAVLARIERGWVHDRLTGCWTRFGDGSPCVHPAEGQRAGPVMPAPTFRVGRPESATGHDRFVRMVERAKELIGAGDIYQVNLAHPLRATFEGSTRALFAALASAARPWHGAYLEWNDGRTGQRHAIASVSPELFLEYDPGTRVVRTRPMKGTLAAGLATNAEVLAQSEKDRAELNMIIDLMRNDLGRSCILGSVRVEAARTIETHTDARGAGLLQATGCVSGVLRPDRTPLELVWNAFPPGSVTGAPKVRAMQIIRELETEPRNFYCGSIGFVGDDGRLLLSVAIRTATISGDTIEYPVGAGIVADSDPESEWNETMAKAWPIIRVCESNVSDGSHDPTASPKKATP